MSVFCCIATRLVCDTCDRDERNVTQSQQFEKSPVDFYSSILNNSNVTRWPLPDIVVTFDAYVDELTPIFEKLDLFQVCIC